MNTSIRKFNPGLNQDDSIIIDQYVVRLPLLKSLLEIIEDNTLRPICQHCLYYGPRGRGKTMLMARVSAELRVNSLFSTSWLAIQIMEESYYEINDAAGFWIEVLSTLILQLPPSMQENARLSLNELRAAIWNHPNIEDMARATVLEQLEKADKKAVIILENLHQLIEETSDDFGWYLRNIMQNEPRIMIVATSTTRFEQLDNAKKAFYDIFACNEIRALKRKEAAILWNKLTNSDKTTEQITPVTILTGGSPRLLAIIADFAKDNKLSELLENLTVLVDEHTEYFRSQLEALPVKERRVFTALADLWVESSAKEIAQRARMDIRNTSALLNRLEHRGAIKVNAISARKKNYLVSERLFCIYYKLRRQRSYQAVIDGLVQFMVDFYSVDEINEIRASYNNRKALSHHESILLQKLSNIQVNNIRDYNKIREINNTSNQYGDNTISEPNNPHEKNKTREIIEIIHKLNEKLFSYADKKDYVQAVKVCQQIIAKYGNNKALEITIQVITAMYNQGVVYDLDGNPKKAIKIYQQLIDNYQSNENPEILTQVAGAMLNLGWTYGSDGNTKKAIKIYQQLIDNYQSNENPEIITEVVRALYNLGWTYGRDGNSKKAIAIYLGVIEKHKSSDVNTIQEVVSISLINLAHQSFIQQQWQKAEQYYQQAIEYISEKKPEGSNVILSTSSLGESLSNQMDQISANLQKAIVKLMSQANNQSPKEERMTLALGIAALLPTNRALAILNQGGESQVLLPVIVALQQLNKEQVRASVEVLEVAEDVKQRLVEIRKQYLD
jgi:tetratricopeptide (TPR) repeat protein